MTDIRQFFFWFLSEIPAFLMSEPIKYFLGFYFGGLAIWLFHRIISGRR